MTAAAGVRRPAGPDAGPAADPDAGAAAALAKAPCGTLHVEGLGVCKDPDVLLLEDRGRPMFFCPDECALARVATRGPRATLWVPGAQFRGRLAHLGAERVGAALVHRVVLAVDD